MAVYKAAISFFEKNLRIIRNNFGKTAIWS
ncbi:hypothetical protein MCERE19_02692 [Spirosomataceae bacterium]